MMVPTMLGQGKNIWEAEAHAAAELCDFLRFNCKYAEEIYSQQPPKNAPGIWNRTEFCGLEGFVFAVSPISFTAIGGKFPTAPALMGNVVVWKPSPGAVYSNYLFYEILVEADLPAGVVQFVPRTAEEICGYDIDSPDFDSLHFTGSTYVFHKLWQKVGNKINSYRCYPRIVGEAGGKNNYLLHPSLDEAGVCHTALQTIRGAFEYQVKRVLLVFKKLTDKHAKTTQGLVTESHHFSGPIINKFAFDKIKSFINHAAVDNNCAIIDDGKRDDSAGYFIEPTVTKDKLTKSMNDETFGPVVTIYVYEDAEFKQTFRFVVEATEYGLTGAFFAKDRQRFQLVVYHYW